MNREDTVRAALKALADHDRAREAQTPAHAIFAKRRARRWNVGTTFGAIGLAAAAALVAMWMQPAPVISPPRPPAAPPQEVAVELVPEPVVVAIAEVKPEPPPSPKQTKRAAPQEPPREIVTDFFPLMDVPPPFERGQLLRVVVPVATMRTVGLPVNPDRWQESVQADVLIGEEGMARAIRFVSYEQ